MGVEKLSISLDTDLVWLLQQEVARTQETRSGVVARLIEEVLRQGNGRPTLDDHQSWLEGLEDRMKRLEQIAEGRYG